MDSSFKDACDPRSKRGPVGPSNQNEICLQQSATSLSSAMKSSHDQNMLLNVAQCFSMASKCSILHVVRERPAFVVWTAGADDQDAEAARLAQEQEFFKFKTKYDRSKATVTRTGAAWSADVSLPSVGEYHQLHTAATCRAAHPEMLLCVVFRL